VLAFTVADMACGGSSTSNPSSASPTVTSVAITGTASLSYIGQTTGLLATATLTSGLAENLSNQAMWSSSNPAVALVSVYGSVTAVDVGTAVISAAYQGKTGTILISVSGGAAPPPPPAPCTNSAGGSVTAQINGVAMTGCVVSADINNTTLAFTAYMGAGNTALSFSLILNSGVIGLGTYSNDFFVSMVDSAGDDWVVGGTEPEIGTLTITTLTETQVAGTLSFTAFEDFGPSQGFTNGVFNINVPATGRSQSPASSARRGFR
jgi:hypothetical protein